MANPFDLNSSFEGILESIRDGKPLEAGLYTLSFYGNVAAEVLSIIPKSKYYSKFIDAFNIGGKTFFETGSVSQSIKDIGTDIITDELFDFGYKKVISKTGLSSRINKGLYKAIKNNFGNYGLPNYIKKSEQKIGVEIINKFIKKITKKGIKRLIPKRNS